MSDARPPQVFGVGVVVGQALWVFVRRFPTALLISMPGLVVGGLLVWSAYWVFEESRLVVVPYRYDEFVGIGSIMLCVGVATGLMAGPLTRLAKDAEQGRSTDILMTMGAIFHRPFASVTCGFLTVAVTFIPVFTFMLSGYSTGFLILTLSALAGCWALAHWGISVPVVHADGQGLGALGRASRLGRDYRLSVGGTFFVMLTIAFVLGGGLIGVLAIGTQFLMSELGGISYLPRPWRTIMPIFYLGMTAFLIIGFMATGAAIIRARLVEIKEPLDIAPLVDLFD